MSNLEERIQILKSQYSYTYKLNHRCILYEIKQDFKKAGKLYLGLSSKIQFFINSFYKDCGIGYLNLSDMEKSIIDKLLDFEANANIKYESIEKEGKNYHLFLSNRSIDNVMSYSVFGISIKDQKNDKFYPTKDSAEQIHYKSSSNNHKLKKIEFTHKKSKSSGTYSDISITPERLRSISFKETSEIVRSNHEKARRLSRQSEKGFINHSRASSVNTQLNLPFQALSEHNAKFLEYNMPERSLSQKSAYSNERQHSSKQQQDGKDSNSNHSKSLKKTSSRLEAYSRRFKEKKTEKPSKDKVAPFSQEPTIPYDIELSSKLFDPVFSLDPKSSDERKSSLDTKSSTDSNSSVDRKSSVDTKFSFDPLPLMDPKPPIEKKLSFNLNPTIDPKPAEKTVFSTDPISPTDHSSFDPKLKEFTSNVHKNNKPRLTESDLSKLPPLEAKIYKAMLDIKNPNVKSCIQVIKDMLVRTNPQIQWSEFFGIDNIKKKLQKKLSHDIDRSQSKVDFSNLKSKTQTNVLLYGPQGAGKKSVAKCLAYQSNHVLFEVNASQLLVQYLDESTNIVDALFYLANKVAPSIIFVEDIESLLSTGMPGDFDVFYNTKKRFSEHVTKVTDSNENEIQLIGSTVSPWLINDEERTNFGDILYVAKPEFESRVNFLRDYLFEKPNTLKTVDYYVIAKLTAGFRFVDMVTLCDEAMLIPLKEMGEYLLTSESESIRGLRLSDLKKKVKDFFSDDFGDDNSKKYLEWKRLNEVAE